MEQELRPGLENISELTLDEIQRFQASVDAVTWTAPADPEGKTRHIFLHLVTLAGKLARIEERAEHGLYEDTHMDDAIADLIIYAAQLAEIRKRPLSSLYRRRVRRNLERLPNRG